jgi:hypothetical protein
MSIDEAKQELGMMNGQWIGSYTGSSSGELVVNIDERFDHYEGIAYLTESNSQLPNTLAHFKTNSKDKEFQFETELIFPFDPKSGSPMQWEAVKRHYDENVTLSKRATVDGVLTDNALKLSWVSDVPGLHGAAALSG